jgi:hypothetical protein
MTKEQAIKLLRKDTSISEIHKLRDNGLSHTEVTDAIQEAMDLGADAIEKTIAKKPTVLINDKDVRIGNILFKKGVKTYKCVCGYWITLTQEYCNHCGQRILWEGDE